MLYTYACKKCAAAQGEDFVDFEVTFPMGQAPKVHSCPKCGSECQRSYRQMNFQLKGDGWASKDMAVCSEMTKRNKQAGERMKGRTPPVSLAAYDYGNGDVREVKKPTKKRK